LKTAVSKSGCVCTGIELQAVGLEMRRLSWQVWCGFWEWARCGCTDVPLL